MEDWDDLVMEQHRTKRVRQHHGGNTVVDFPKKGFEPTDAFRGIVCSKVWLSCKWSQSGACLVPGLFRHCRIAGFVDSIAWIQCIVCYCIVCKLLHVCFEH